MDVVMKKPLLMGIAWTLTQCCLADFAYAAQALGISQALALASQNSGKLGGANAAVTQAQEQVQAVAGLGGPILALTGMGYSFERQQNISLQPYASNINGMISGLPIPPSALPIPIDIPTLPDSVNLHVRKTGAVGFVNAILPLYTGGRIDGVRGVAAGRASESVANAQQERDEVQATLIQRYFGVQATAQVAQLREAARVGVAEHLATAKRMEAAGLLAKVERLQADVAYANALRDAAKAQHDSALARRALDSMLDTEYAAAVLATPLFVDTRDLEPLEHYVTRALAAHPGMAIVSAKRQQTEGLHQIEEGIHKPSVFAYGVAEPHKGRPDWMVGIVLNWVLIDGTDRAALSRSSVAAAQRVDQAERQARQDIALLVERNYRNLDQAKLKYLALRADEELAREYLRLRVKSLASGLGTAVEVIDAQLNLAKVQAEQTGAAYEYSMALVALLSTTGELANFPQLAQSADIQHPQ
ncbi:TolC family protein [Undibacterium parvum]|uniref:TolC family protein n=2 Tax=Undibacterium parvum TaxID=401471 RepID=A0A3Q9BN45_9BURK|nr:TolC family protein [Undibacterium parvum]